MLTDPFQRLGLDREILSVSQLNQRARHLLEDVFPQIWVEGELSNLARPASGHLYFTLKDTQAQIRCALFRHNAVKVRQALANGLAVRVRGKVSVFEGRGDYQLLIDALEMAGEGALRQAFEALKAKLADEGLFASERKRPLPAHPRRIGIITSPTGAVIRDIISVFRRRAPQVELTLIPTAVQGQEATAQIIRALHLADQQHFDALILARGGGSLEDLWCFNEEAVARAIDGCQTPIVSAIGHEVDISISDFVADMRAPTPSAAAELLAPDSTELQRQLHSLYHRLQLSLSNALHHQKLCLNALSKRLRHPRERLQQQAQQADQLELRLRRAIDGILQRQRDQLQRFQSALTGRHPGQTLAQLRQRLENLDRRLSRALQEDLKHRRQQLQSQMQALHIVSPLNTLARGYSILLDRQGKAIRQAGSVQIGQTLNARLSEGRLTLTVTDNHCDPANLSLLD